ncbi:AraC family transcriptional regulator [Myxococcus stipitatus DSM 14675]|uniref:AraC family transcriptional regulator n=1 Tax=Myxococcus stipitatus (strain DSM 14675 / JCM 12634 / Mx s8) TaxID=1278073 RepID=L7U9D7_MYXSD|nr:AraC family transcriptional regulator [Myxococcus stipitatus]AGC44187.1 AraC family transcriptional regulator [Myxococcus stipitatus DSM 14675]
MGSDACPAPDRGIGPGIIRGSMAGPHAFYRAVAPPPALRPYIHAFWVYEGYLPAHGRERVLPTGTVEWVIPLAGQRLEWRELDGAEGHHSGAHVAGPRLTAYDVPTAQQALLAGVHFRVGGAWPLLGIPQEELAERHVELASVWGADVEDWVTRLREAKGTEDRFALLGELFLARLDVRRASHPEVARALARLHESAAEVSVASLVMGSGLSHRRFIELFRREVGLTPRDLLRVRRFQRALASTRRGASPSLTWLAHEAGYFDQSHWLLECRKLAGLSPGALVSTARGAEVLPPEERGQMLPIG